MRFARCKSQTDRQPVSSCFSRPRGCDLISYLGRQGPWPVHALGFADFGR